MRKPSIKRALANIKTVDDLLSQDNVAKVLDGLMADRVNIKGIITITADYNNEISVRAAGVSRYEALGLCVVAKENLMYEGKTE